MRELGEEIRSYIDGAVKPLPLDEAVDERRSLSPHPREARARWRAAASALAAAVALASVAVAAVTLARSDSEGQGDSAAVATPDQQGLTPEERCVSGMGGAGDEESGAFDHATGELLDISPAEQCRLLASVQPYSDVELQNAGLEAIGFFANGKPQIVYEETKHFIDDNGDTFVNSGVQVAPEDVARRVAQAKTFHCEPGDPDESFEDPETGRTDYNRIPRWVPVISVPHGGWVGCLPRALAFSEIDGERTMEEFLERAQLDPDRGLPLPVFGPDGELAGYMAATGGFLDLPAAAPFLNEALRSNRPSPADFIIAPEAASELSSGAAIEACLAERAEAAEGVEELARAEGMPVPRFGVFDHGTKRHVEMDPKEYCELSAAAPRPEFTAEGMAAANLDAVQLFRDGRFVIEYIERDTGDPVPHDEAARRVDAVRTGG